MNYGVYGGEVFPLCLHARLHGAEEVVRSNHWDATNPLNYEYLVLNSPRNKEFDPRLPWVYMVNKEE